MKTGHRYARFMRKASVQELLPLTQNLQTGETGIPVVCHLVVLLRVKEKMFLAGQP